MSEIDKLHARIRQLEDEILRVRADAAASVFFWGQFASNYSKAHWGLEADITRLRGPVAMEVVFGHPQAPERLPVASTAGPVRSIGQARESR